MNRQRTSMPASFLAATLAIPFLLAVAHGQQVAGSGGTVKDPVGGGTTATPAQKTKAPVKTVIRTEVRLVTPTTGSLAVAAESQASLLLEPLNIRNGQGQKGVVPSGERIFVFNGLKP